jgi:hypothetical protein
VRGTIRRAFLIVLGMRNVSDKSCGGN